MRRFTLFLVLILPGFAIERAAYDSNGRIIALLSANAADVEVTSNAVAVLPSGKRVPILTRREGRGAVRQGSDLAWTMAFSLPDGGRGKLDIKSVESADAVVYTTSVTAESVLEVEAIDVVLDLSRAGFLGGRVSVPGTGAVMLAKTMPPRQTFLSAETTSLRVEAADPMLALDLGLSAATPVSLRDRWDSFGRSFQLRAVLQRGPMAAGASATLPLTIRLSRQAASPEPPVTLLLDSSRVRARFSGFGGNFCWNNRSPISTYTVENLKLAWARSEMKLQQWDKQRGQPGPELQGDFEMMRRFQRMGIPYVISIWWLPERFYTDPYEKPRSTHFRLIHPDQWDEFLDLLESYLVYARQQYGVEPDLFSFNESNIGVYVGQTPEAHTEALKRIGARFVKAGLKTRMLLGDATGPRDTHKFVLDAAADPEAMQYVGAIGFHSWGGGTPDQYKAWGDVGEWLNLPLLVTELGVDAAAYYTRSWDSYHYGLREAQMTQELLIYARPQGTQFWQFTNDYALARVGPRGAVEPTPRFWLMKHFTDLTPQASESLMTDSPQKEILFTAFRKGDALTLHILNLGASRQVRIEGVPDAPWKAIQTTEERQYQSLTAVPSTERSLVLSLAARSLTTLTRQP